jgi:hypothetical protein
MPHGGTCQLIFSPPIFLSETATQPGVVTPDSAMAVSLVSTLGGGADSVRKTNKDGSISKDRKDLGTPLVLTFCFGFCLKPFLGSWGCLFAPILRAGSQLPFVEVAAGRAAPEALVWVAHRFAPGMLAGGFGGLLGWRYRLGISLLRENPGQG